MPAPVQKRPQSPAGILLLISVALIRTCQPDSKAALAPILIYTGYKLAKPPVPVRFTAGLGPVFCLPDHDPKRPPDRPAQRVLIRYQYRFIFRYPQRSLRISDQRARNRYLFRLRKTFSFLKPIIKQTGTGSRNASWSSVDIWADFDRDVIETIEDFYAARPLKNNQVELKKSQQRHHRI